MSNIPQTSLPAPQGRPLRHAEKIISVISKNNLTQPHYAVGFFAAAKYAHLLPKEVRDQIEKDLGQWGLEAMNRLNKELNS